MRRSKQHLLDKYASLSFFSAWSQEELIRLDRTATELEFEPGEVISRDLATGGEFLILVLGRATLEGGPRHGDEIVAGDHVGDVGMLVPGRMPAALIAQTYSRALVLSNADFRNMLATTPSFGRVISNRLAHRVAQLVDTTRILPQPRLALANSRRTKHHG